MDGKAMFEMVLQALHQQLRLCLRPRGATGMNLVGVTGRLPRLLPPQLLHQRYQMQDSFQKCER